MNVLDALPMATGVAWLTWQPVTPAECMTLVLGVAALTRMVDERTAALMRSLETVIERTKGN